MGYKMSGEALEIVAIAEEVIVLYHLGKQNKPRIRIGELRNYPEEFVDVSVQAEISMAKGVKTFRRYVDDVHSQIAGTEKETLNGILALGFMYPESLVVRMVIYLQFLIILISFPVV